MLKDELWFLLNEDKLPLYRDPVNGHILVADGNFQQPNGQPANLKSSPTGWKDVKVDYVRNEKYWGMFRNSSSEFEFPKDGGSILSNKFWTGKGVESIVYPCLQKLDRLNLPYQYKNFYTSEIDFSKFIETNNSVKVQAVEGGVSKYIKANENKVYEFKVDEDPEVKKVLTNGMSFDFNRKFAIIGDQEIHGTSNYYLGMVELTHEGNPVDIFTQDIVPTASSAYPNDKWFMSFERVQEITIRGHIPIYFDKNVVFQLRVETNDGATSGFPQYVLVNIAGAARPAGTTESFDFNQTFTIPANDKINMKIFGGSGVDSTTQFTVLDGGEIFIDYVYKYKATYTNGLYLFRLLQLLFEKMTDGKYSPKSAWLQNKKDIIFTSGDCIRGLHFDDSNPDNIVQSPVIKISFNDFFQYLRTLGGGFGIEGEFGVLEQLSYFFKSSITANIGKVLNAEISVAEGLMFNRILAGYDKQDYTDVNGKYETNQGQEWSTTITKILEDLNLVSPVRADPLGIELTRINFEGRITTDSSSDNDNFVLNVNTIELTDVDDPLIKYYELYRPAFTAVTGLPHWEDSFNLLLTPKQNILNNEGLIHALLDLQDIEKLKLTTADKNKELSTTLAGVTVTQKEDIGIGSMAAKLFLPYFFTFTTKTPVNLPELLTANQYGKIQFEWKGKQWYGYLWEGGIKPATLESQSWVLLAAPGQLLQKFNSK